MSQADRVFRRRRHSLSTPGVEGDVVVIPVRRRERRCRHPHLELEAERVDIEGEPPLDVTDVEVDVPDPQVLVDVEGRLLAGDDSQQPGQVERPRAPADLAQVGPLLTGPVGRELDLVAVRIGQVDRLGHAVVGGPVDRGPR